MRKLGAPLIFMAGALAFAAWAWTRSDALDQAETLAVRASTPEAMANVARLALDQLDRQPWNRGAARLAAVTLSRLDYPDAAEPFYRRAGDLSLADARTRAYALVRANRRDEAIKAFENILTLSPDDIPALQMLGGLWYSRKQYDLALEAARRLQGISGGEVQGHWRAATILHEIHYLDDAASEYEEVFRLDPELKQIPEEAHTWFWRRAIDDLLKLGRAARARSVLEPVVARSNDPKLAVLLGRAQYQSGAHDEAEATWSHVVEAHPRESEAWLELGRARLARGELETAVTALERAIALAPKEIEAHYSLRTAYTRQGKTQDARRVGERLDQLRSGAPPPPGGMGPKGMPPS